MTFRQAQAALALAAMVRSPTKRLAAARQRRIEIVSPSPIVAGRAGRVSHSRNDVIVTPKTETVIERKFAYGRVSKDLEDEDVSR